MLHDGSCCCCDRDEEEEDTDNRCGSSGAFGIERTTDPFASKPFGAISFVSVSTVLLSMSFGSVCLVILVSACTKRFCLLVVLLCV